MKDLDNTLQELGITMEMVKSCRMPVCDEASILVDAGEDMFGRPQKMTVSTCKSWQVMRQAAAADGVELKLVSAFRSIDYQCDVIRGKLDEGRTIEDILSVNAIPGHSEHHTGRALDLHTGNGNPLAEDFDQTDAFNWLISNANKFRFQMSYPRNNAEGITYEPWHWCCHA